MSWTEFYDECLRLSEVNRVIIYDIEFWLWQWKEGYTPKRAYSVWLDRVRKNWRSEFGR